MDFDMLRSVDSAMLWHVESDMLRWPGDLFNVDTPSLNRLDAIRSGPSLLLLTDR